MVIQPFVLNPTNAAFLSGHQARPAQLRGARVQTTCLLIFLLPFVAVALFLAAYCAHTLYRQVVLLRSSALVIGRVVDRATFEDEGTNYRLTYEFTLGESAYEHTQITPQAIYEQYALGQSIPINYAAANPAVSVIEGTDSWGMDAFLFGFALCWWLFIGAVIYSLVRAGLRNERLLRHGRLIYGELVRIQGVLDSDNNYTVTVTARFTPPDTQLPTSGDRKYLCNHLQTASLPPATAPLAIFYAHADHWEIL